MNGENVVCRLHCVFESGWTITGSKVVASKVETPEYALDLNWHGLLGRTRTGALTLKRQPLYRLRQGESSSLSSFRDACRTLYYQAEKRSSRAGA